MNNPDFKNPNTAVEPEVSLNRTSQIMLGYEAFMEVWTDMANAIAKGEKSKRKIQKITDRLWSLAEGNPPTTLDDPDARMPVRLNEGLFAGLHQFGVYLASIDLYLEVHPTIAVMMTPIPEWAKELQAAAAFADWLDVYHAALGDGDIPMVEAALDNLTNLAYNFHWREENVVNARFTESQRERFNASLMDLWQLVPTQAGGDPLFKTDAEVLTELSGQVGTIDRFTDLPAYCYPDGQEEAGERVRMSRDGRRIKSAIVRVRRPRKD